MCLYIFKGENMFVLDINKISKQIKFLVLILSLFFGLIFGADSGSERLQNSLKTICGQLYNLLPPVAILLVVAGAVVYGIGQFAGAEMRAKSTSWATAMIIGALFAFILVLFLPGVIVALFRGDQNQNWTDYCSV
jgi:type IV secretory pathway VirB2 component (pilin)